MDHPKVFISYSWQPKSNQIRVQKLAERLISDGVYVIIDMFDLLAGQSIIKFVKQNVANQEVTKILMICEKEYCKKANEIKSGVGYENAIIFSELYKNIDQNRIIPIVFENDDKGLPYIPHYAKSLLFIDLSCEDIFEKGYDELLRTIYGKPRLQRPALGKMPSYLETEVPTMLPTAHKVKDIKQAILTGNPNVQLIIEDYFDAFISALPYYRIDELNLTADNYIDKIEQGIVELIPLKNDFLEFVQTVSGSQYLTGELLSDFLERMLQQYADNNISLYTGSSLYSLCIDNYRYFNFDLFVSVIAILLRKAQFDIIYEVVSRHFCILEDGNMEQPKEVSFMRFNKYNYTLNKFKNDDYYSHRVSIVADTIRKFSTIISFEDLVNADILLYYLSLIYPSKDVFERYWFPELSHYNHMLIILPKLASTRYFNKCKVMFNVETVEEFKKLISSIKEPDIHDGIHRIPNIEIGLSINNVGTIS